MTNSDKMLIVAEDKVHLKMLIKNEIKLNGKQCDLNHIDVSKINDMNCLFVGYMFDGDISKWDVSNVEDMGSMFLGSNFNGNISNWNVSKVKNMIDMFLDSKFNGNLSDWKPYSLVDTENAFYFCSAPLPYWLIYGNNMIARNKAIDSYVLEKELNQELGENNLQKKKVKI